MDTSMELLAFLLIGLLAFLRGNTLSGGLLVTLGALVKPVALLVLPVLWRPWNWRLPLVVGATVAVAYLHLSPWEPAFSGSCQTTFARMVSPPARVTSCCGW
jgi:hypothetical protein